MSIRAASCAATNIPGAQLVHCAAGPSMHRQIARAEHVAFTRLGRAQADVARAGDGDLRAARLERVEPGVAGAGNIDFGLVCLATGRYPARAGDIEIGAASAERADLNVARTGELRGEGLGLRPVDAKIA